MLARHVLGGDPRLAVARLPHLRLLTRLDLARLDLARLDRRLPRLHALSLLHPLLAALHGDGRSHFRTRLGQLDGRPEDLHAVALHLRDPALRGVPRLGDLIVAHRPAGHLRDPLLVEAPVEDPVVDHRDVGDVARSP